MQRFQPFGHRITQSVLCHLASKWSPSILRELRDRSHRYSELRTRIGGISEKMLAQTLRELERDGLVLRTSFPVVPPHVVYALTPLGHECSEIVIALVCWLQSNLAEFERAHHRYDGDSCTAHSDRDARTSGEQHAENQREPMQARTLPSSSGVGAAA
jgi:DNA-binding HxlR family transcriptional regulator